MAQQEPTRQRSETGRNKTPTPAPAVGYSGAGFFLARFGVLCHFYYAWQVATILLLLLLQETVSLSESIVRIGSTGENGCSISTGNRCEAHVIPLLRLRWPKLFSQASFYQSGGDDCESFSSWHDSYLIVGVIPRQPRSWLLVIQLLVGIKALRVVFQI